MPHRPRGGNRPISGDFDNVSVVRRGNGATRRTSIQAAADRQAQELARDLGRTLRQARRERRLSQAQAAALAGISPSRWSQLEVRGDAGVTLATWNRAASAIGSRLKAYLGAVSSANQPRDAAHLRGQELVLRTARPGGWHGLPEQQIDREARTSRSADILLQRALEYGLIEIFDWISDVGAEARDWHRRLAAVERFAIARTTADQGLPRVCGTWVVRATRRNRQLVRDYHEFFAALLPGSAAAWLAALSDPALPMPTAPALVWISVTGDRLFASRRTEVAAVGRSARSEQIG